MTIPSTCDDQRPRYRAAHAAPWLMLVIGGTWIAGIVVSSAVGDGNTTFAVGLLPTVLAVLIPLSIGLFMAIAAVFRHDATLCRTCSSMDPAAQARRMRNRRRLFSLTHLFDRLWLPVAVTSALIAALVIVGGISNITTRTILYIVLAVMWLGTCASIDHALYRDHCAHCPRAAELG